MDSPGELRSRESLRSLVSSRFPLLTGEQCVSNLSLILYVHENEI